MRRFVVLVFAAMLVSYCGTPPPTGTVLDESASGETGQTEEEAEQDSNAIKIGAAVTGAAVVLCYTVPKFTPKLKAKNINCRGLIKNGAQKTSAAFKKAGNKIAEVGRSVGQKVKNLAKRGSKNADETAEGADDAAKSATKNGDEGQS